MTEVSLASSPVDEQILDEERRSDDPDLGAWSGGDRVEKLVDDVASEWPVDELAEARRVAFTVEVGRRRVEPAFA